MYRLPCLLHQYRKQLQQKKKEKKPIMSCASSGHITKLKQSILRLSISMVVSKSREEIKNKKKENEAKNVSVVSINNVIYKNSLVGSSLINSKRKNK
jgi:hypothetical protein